MAAFENKTVLCFVWKSPQQKSKPYRNQPINTSPYQKVFANRL